MSTNDEAGKWYWCEWCQCWQAFVVAECEHGRPYRRRRNKAERLRWKRLNRMVNAAYKHFIDLRSQAPYFPTASTIYGKDVEAANAWARENWSRQ